MKAHLQVIFTLDELAAYLKVGKRTLYRLAAHGEIPAFKVGALSFAAGKRSERESSIFLLEV
ncbi:helix-turn-helix transcriptional regulator [Acinetobacter baumannii]|uniref:helix-turn-helix transcriptional regulator n=1 Tax=Acinetobacter baumannii TaxID=470 RepID=UPI002152217D|nr:helix-turn-helix domain-containing protein [Acinetobacter baumannii]MCR6569889.1 helix-turn-helix domain-containing protein [Acinetobacter baumannii]MDV4324009.1 helix-turn-helix domain-containing protein [Acinetobacter baumannii]MDV4338420.1 helix-turn-helix domain-containing protein [Acinetobacter baumannii]